MFTCAVTSQAKLALNH